MNYYGYEVIREEEIRHHGILGQKWGQRNGPPYPLGVSDHSASERKAGWRKSLEDDVEESKSKTEKNTKNSTKTVTADTDKNRRNVTVKDVLNSKAFKTAMGVTIGAVATYAAYKLGKDYVLDLVNSASTTNLLMSPQKYQDWSEVPRYKKSLAEAYFSGDENAWKKIVGGVNHGSVDMKNPLRNRNCTFCSAAIIARMKGYKVTAAELKGNGFTADTVMNWFYTGANFEKPNCKTVKELEAYLASQGDGHYGTMHIKPKGILTRPHSIVYAVKNGNVEIMDGQIQGLYGDHDKLFKFYNINNVKVADLTHADLSWTALKAVI